MDLTPQSPWFKPADLEEYGGERVVTIKVVNEDEVGSEKELKNVLYVKETDKKIVLNKTLTLQLIDATGTSDSDEMKGKKITLIIDPNVRNPRTGVTGPAVRIKTKGSKLVKKATVEADSDLGID